MISEHDRIFKNLPHQKELTLKDAQEQGDWMGLGDLLAQKPDSLQSLVRASQIREKDDSGVIVSEKWNSLQGKDLTPFLVIDASRGVPGDVSALYLVYYETYKIIEGTLLTAFMVGSERGYIYMSADQPHAFEVMQRVVQEAYTEGLLGNNIMGTGFNFHLEVHLGSAAYVKYSADKMIDALAGERQPRGTLFGKPVLVHHVETVAALPTLLKKGVNWFASLGTPGSAGTKVFSLSGHVNRPCVFEERLGVSLRTTLEHHGGGVRGGWSHLNFIFPSGIGSPLLLRSFCQDLTLSYESLSSFHSFLGSGALVIGNGSLSLWAATCTAFSFFVHSPAESCLFCSKGLPVCEQLLKSLQGFDSNVAKENPIRKNLEQWTWKIAKRCQCGYADHALTVVKGYLRYGEGERSFDPLNSDSVNEALHAN